MPLSSAIRQKRQQPFSSQSKVLPSKVIAILWVLLFSLTFLGTTHNFRLTMMGLITFVLAYLSKGLRQRSR